MYLLLKSKFFLFQCSVTKNILIIATTVIVVIIDLQTIIIHDKTVDFFFPYRVMEETYRRRRHGRAKRCVVVRVRPEYRSARFASATSPYDSVHVAPRHSAPIRTTNGRCPCAVPSPFGRVEIGPETRRRTPVNVELENAVVFDPIRPWRTERSRKSRPTDRFASARRPPHGRLRKCFWPSVSVSRNRRTLWGIPWRSFKGRARK